MIRSCTLCIYYQTSFILGSVKFEHFSSHSLGDLFRAPLVHAIRRANNDIKDITFLDVEFCKELACTRFLGVGNPSESGHHLLYYFRQENSLPKAAFINSHEIFSPELSASEFT